MSLTETLQTSTARPLRCTATLDGSDFRLVSLFNVPHLCLSGGDSIRTSLSTNIMPNLQRAIVVTVIQFYIVIPCHVPWKKISRLLLWAWKTVQRVRVSINNERAASWESKAFVNMATAVGRLLSFSKNAKVFIAPLRLTSVPFHRYGVEMSSTGEPITHTGQVSSKIWIKRCFDVFSSAVAALA